MDLFLIILISLVIICLLYFIIMYNSFAKQGVLVDEAFSTMDVFLKKRWDLIPNLVEVVKGYAKHEKDTLSEIAKLRENVYDNMSNSDKIDVNEKLTGEITKLIAIAESYPELKANDNFLSLSSNLTKIEDEIAQSRKYYNAVVREFNIKVKTIPSCLVAKLLDVKGKKMFEAKEFEKNDVKVEL